MRLFFALPLPEPVRTSLADWQARARAAGLAAAYPRPEGLHLTLVFLGQVEPARVSALAEVAAQVAAQHGPFGLRTGATGVFPARGPIKVVWLGIEPCGALDSLQADLAGALAPLGFPPEARPFVPHLTLARPKGRWKGASLPEPPPPRAWTAQEGCLYESLADREGPRYEVRGRWPFSGSVPLR